MMPPTKGIICRPAAVADEPLTICRYSGTVIRPPNIAMPRIVLEVEPTATVRFLNRRHGRQPRAFVPPLGKEKRTQPNQADGVAADRPRRVPAPGATLLG